MRQMRHVCLLRGIKICAIVIVDLEGDGQAPCDSVNILGDDNACSGDIALSFTRQ